MKRIRILYHFLINVIFFFVLLPIYLLIILLLLIIGHLAKKNKTVIFAGLEHVIDKTVVRGNFFKKKGFNILYYSFEMTGRKSISVDDKTIIKAHEYFALDILLFAFKCIKNRPVYVELYFEGLGISQVGYALTCKLLDVLSISILRGELYNFKNKSRLKNMFRVIAWKLSGMIFYREIYMERYFNSLRIDSKKIYFDPNKVKIRGNALFKKERPNVLFLNGMKKWRRIELLISSIPLVIKEHSNANFIIVGCRNKDEYKSVCNLVKENKVENNVSINYWTSNSKKYYEIASIFVLPADLVFCNFSLIECMERGVPAIVADVIDADKIVTHGINGFLVKQNPEDIAKHINILLSNESLRIKMGQEARKTIINNFNDRDRMKPIYNFLISKYPKLMS